MSVQQRTDEQCVPRRIRFRVFEFEIIEKCESVQDNRSGFFWGKKFIGVYGLRMIGSDFVECFHIFCRGVFFRSQFPCV